MRSFHQHASLFPHLAEALNQLLQGYVLSDAWVKDKLELSLIFTQNHEALSLQLNTEAKTGLFFFKEYAIERSAGVQPVFKELVGKNLERVTAHFHNRSFQMDFGQAHLLIFKLYGPLSNVLLMEAGKVQQLFRPAIENDFHLSLKDFENPQVQPEQPFTGFYHVGHEAGEPSKTGLAFEPYAQNLLKTDVIFEALNEFSGRFLQEFLFEERYRNIQKQLRQKIKREEGLIHGAQTFLQHAQSAVPPDEIGHILMANLHLLQKGQTLATLFNFYRNEPIEIELKKDISPQENAARYYKKAKNRKKEIELKQVQLEQSTLKLAQLQLEWEKLEKAASIKELKPWIKEEKQKEAVSIREKFRRFELNGFQVYVGKNALNNDLLTLKFAHKDDLWLHAKGVSGSHVIIKHKPQLPFPEPVISFAASIAAHYSSSAGAEWVPVIYTPKKYVRKPKGAHAGQVAVEREEIILVRPALPQH